MTTARRLASRSLTDQHGEWCALCLRYFSPNEPRDLHHVLNRARIRDRFGSSLDFAWVIPMHQDCHRRLQGIADAAAVYFVEILDGAPSLVEREKLTRQFHERGYYWLSVLANLDTMQAQIEGIDDEQRLRRCEFALSSSAGVRGGQNLPNILISSAIPKQSPRIQLNLSNLQAARGHQAAAKRSFELATEIIENLPAQERASLLPGLLRRRAQLSRFTAHAREAVIAAESEYSKNTALVFQGVLGVSNKDFSYVEESLEELFARKGTMSWLYEAETYFIQALYWLVTGNDDVAAVYSSLCMAQYIYVVLGLQMSITPELQVEGPTDRSWDWTPSDVVRTFFSSQPAYRMLDADACYYIRKGVIWDTHLLEQLLDPLAGWGEETRPGIGHLTDRLTRE